MGLFPKLQVCISAFVVYPSYGLRSESASYSHTSCHIRGCSSDSNTLQPATQIDSLFLRIARIATVFTCGASVPLHVHTRAPIHSPPPCPTN